MISLQSLEPLFAEEAPIPREALKHRIAEDIKLRVFTGVPESRLDISHDPEDETGIIIKLIDPRAAAGYLVFQGETEYYDWLNSQLYEPTQEEIQEAGQRGSGP